MDRGIGPGKPYPVSYVEWRVFCGHPDCEDDEILASDDDNCDSEEEAELNYTSGDGETISPILKWRKIDGKWYCPLHAKGK